MDFTTDHDVLRAALEFVDAFDPHQPLHKTSPAARLRWELETLREETKLLEHQLQLQRLSTQRQLASAAQEVALCQRERRRRAEVDNARLRSRLRETSLLTRRFAKAVKAASKERARALQHLFPALSSIPRPLGTVEWSNLTHEALRMCEQAATIFAHSHFAPAAGRDPCATRQALTTRPTRQGLHIELVESRGTPFDFLATSAALWHHVVHHKACGDILVNTREYVADDQAEREFLFRWGPPEVCTVFQTRFVGRRMRTSGSVMIAWAVENQAEVEGERLTMSKNALMLVQPLQIDTKQDQKSRPVSLVQTYLVSTPSSRLSKSRLVEDALETIERRMEEEWGQVESLLLDPVRHVVSRYHQKQDFEAHKRVCKRAKQCRDLIAKEETALRNAPADMFLPDNIFEERVGHFWGIHETRPYIRAKFELIRSMSVMPSHAAISAGLAEAMDCLRLCRSDNMGVRDGIPTLQLLIGQLQACYDFIKWWATCDPHGTYDWGNVELPYLSVKDADMTEGLDDFENEHAVFHLAALTCITMTLANEVEEAVNARLVAENASLPAPVGDSLSGFLTATGDHSLEELNALHKKLAQQAAKAFKLVHLRNKHYWNAVLDSMPLAREPDPGYYSQGDRFEIKLWVVPNALLWRDATVLIKANAKKL